MKAFLLIAAVQAASYLGTLNVNSSLYSSEVLLTASDSLSCSSLTSPNSTLSSLTANTLIADTLLTDLLVAKNGVLRLSNNVKVTGQVVYGQPTAFVEREESGYMSFLGASRRDLEDRLNNKRPGHFSFVQLQGVWTSLGDFSLEKHRLKLEGLEPHSKVSLSTNVYFEGSGSAFLIVDGQVVWMEACEWCNEPWSSSVQVSFKHTHPVLLAEFKSATAFRVSDVYVGIRNCTVKT